MRDALRCLRCNKPYVMDDPDIVSVRFFFCKACEAILNLRGPASKCYGSDW